MSLIRHLASWVRVHLAREFLQMFTVTLGSRSRVGKASVPLIGHSGLLPTVGLDRWAQLTQEWQETFELWADGHYWASVRIRRELLAESYRLQGLDPRTHTPSWLSAGYLSNIGHLGFLGMHGVGRSLGFLARPNRQAVLGPSEGNGTLVNALVSTTEVLRMKSSSSVVESPPLWPHVEPLQMVNAKGIFLDFYEFWESVVAGRESEPRHDLVFDLSETYLEKSRQRLAHMSLPVDGWFVALHFRSDRFPRDARSIDPSTMIPAARFIIESGGRVVQFGSSTSKPLLDHPNYLVAQDLHGPQAELHPYIIKEAEFLLTTNSGPAVVAHILGTDVVQVNTTSISRNALSTWSRSYYLPLMPLHDDGRQFTLEELFSSRYAWAEAPTSPARPVRALSRRSSPQEILLATQDMLLVHGLTSRGTPCDPYLMATVDALRHEHGAVSFGEIAPSFLTQAFA